ncbi:hypothetical protein PLICRDRAFT_35477 [Plicaturopsis crispa FD-325 SS-3]|nr:hypothetical protein PLICRDRAFT_35477 [Plicaturopsis crispa FD-325 SS-3]
MSSTFLASCAGWYRYLSEDPFTLLAVFASLLFLAVLLVRRPGSAGSADSHALDTRIEPCQNLLKEIYVTKILVHPIKSCRGTSVESSRYNSEGLENDRMWAIIEGDSHEIITARKTPKMVLISPRILADDNSASGGILEVNFPDDSGCETFSVPLHPSEDVLSTWEATDRLSLFGHIIHGYIHPSISPSSRSPSAVLSRYFDRPVHLVYKGARQPRPCDPTAAFPDLKATVKYQDGYPLLILSEESLAAVESKIRPLVGVQGIADKWKDETLKIERFRPNIVIRGAGVPFVEDTLKEIVIGSSPAPRISLVSQCPRCLLPNVDPLTGIRDAAVPFKVLMKTRAGVDPARKSGAMLGCNAVSHGEGVVRVGDRILVTEIAGR